VIPFNAKIEGNSDIKNYGDYLFQNAGEAVMAWLIEGAKKAIDLDFKLPLPKCVQEAIGAYRQSSDWFDHFLTDSCDTGDGLWEKSGELYTAYRTYCIETNEYTRSTTDFYAALQNGGFVREKTRTGFIVKGLKLRLREFTETQNEFPDFLE